jgi:nitrous oxidase accessory protein NosD
MRERSSWRSIIFVVGLTLVALALWTSTLVAPGSVEAAVRDVQAGESIQAVIDVALPGDTIRVAQGVFSESLVITKSLILEGGYTDFGTGARTPRTSVILPPTGRGLYIRGSDLQVTVDGFEVTQATNRAVEIDVDSDSVVTLNDNFIHDNSGTGIYADVEYRSALHITHNDVMTNTASGYYGGIYAYVYLSGTLTLTDNDIIGNRSFYDHGGAYLEIESFGRFTIEDNQILSNSTHVDGSTSSPYRSYGGLYFGAYGNSHGTFDRNRVNDNYADDSSGGGTISLEDNSSTTFHDNEFRGNRANYQRYGGLALYVDENSHLVGGRLVITDNEAGEDCGGGNIEAYTSSSIHLPHTQIRGNRAGGSRGGVDVVADYNASVDLSGAQVTDNQTGSDYGGLSLHSGRGSTIDAHDLYIYNNIAHRN